jgi:hypothetical protein
MPRRIATHPLERLLFPHPFLSQPLIPPLETHPASTVLSLPRDSVCQRAISLPFWGTGLGAAYLSIAVEETGARYRHGILFTPKRVERALLTRGTLAGSSYQIQPKDPLQKGEV